MVVSSGFTTYSHLCKGVTQNITLHQENNPTAENCPHCIKNNKKHHKDCCKKAQQEFKLNEKTVLAKQLDVSHKYLGEAVPHRFFGAVFEPAVTVETTATPKFVYHSKPLPANPLYIFYCVYRI